MGDFFSNIGDKFGSSFSNFGDTLINAGSGYVQSFLGMGEPPKQNLTAKQVQQGAVAGPIQGNPMMQGFAGIPLPALIVGGAVILALVLKK